MIVKEEHIILRDMMRKMGKEKIIPRAKEADETMEYPYDLHQLFMDNGLFNIRVPVEYGGAGMDYTSVCIVAEELGRVDGTMANTFIHHQAGSCCFMDGINEEQKQRYLPKVGKGNFLLGFALTEPDSGSDAFSLKTRAVADGDDYIINGNKIFISNSGLSDLYMLFTTVDPSKRRAGVTGFMVEKDTPGFSIAKHENKMGWRASPTCELNFTDMRVSRKNRLGAEGQGWEIVLQSLTETRILVASVALGLAQAAMEAAVEYSKQRKQFGKPISEFQGISFMLADMALMIEPARSLIYQIAAEVDRGNRKQAYLASVAKCFTSDIAMKVTTDAVQVFGGYGYTKDYPVEKMMRDAKACQIVEGANQIQRLNIGRMLLNMFGGAA